ncbi:MAG: envelope stress response membrane protein PspC [Candidatus Hydrogenedentota bacterium]|nr:MAG: envelope stress response membrane protein PspC [Candidatus Hydrogenedentota bacterium]
MTLLVEGRRAGLYRSRDGMIFGVCKGVAEYFDVPVLWVRVIAVVLLVVTCIWLMLGLYLLAALAMKPKPVLPVEREGRRPGLYRSRSGTIFGVCKGIAEYLDLNVFWMRTTAVILLIFTGIWPIAGLYLLAALLMKPEPALPIETEEAQEFYNSYVSSRSMALHRLKRTFDNLDRRIQRMEGIVTAREFDWEQRLNEGS